MIEKLTAGQVEMPGWIQPANTELQRVYADGVYHYEIRPAGYRTPYERAVEKEREAGEASE
jgi:hypothetical protein